MNPQRDDSLNVFLLAFVFRDRIFFGKTEGYSTTLSNIICASLLPPRKPKV